MVAFVRRFDDNTGAARFSYHALGGFTPMTGTRSFWPVLTALAALTFAGGHLSAGDLYTKGLIGEQSLKLSRSNRARRLSHEGVQGVLTI